MIVEFERWWAKESGDDNTTNIPTMTYRGSSKWFCFNIWKSACAEVADENARLREALEDIHQWYEGYTEHHIHTPTALYEIDKIATDALRGIHNDC